MKAWSKYSQVLNDPVRNLNMKLTFQNGDVTTVHSHHLINVGFLFFSYGILISSSVNGTNINSFINFVSLLSPRSRF